MSVIVSNVNNVFYPKNVTDFKYALGRIATVGQGEIVLAPITYSFTSANQTLFTLTGTINAAVPGAQSLVGTGTLFLTQLSVGDLLVVDDGGGFFQTVRVSNIVDNNNIDLDNSLLITLPGGTTANRIDDAMIVPSNCRITGSNGTLITTNSTYTVDLLITNGDGITIDNVSMDAGPGAQSCIGVYNSGDITIQNCSLSIGLIGCVYGVIMSNSLISSNMMLAGGFMSVYLGGVSTDINVKGNTMNGGGSSVLAETTSKLTIEGNSMLNTDGITITNCPDFIISGNTISGGTNGIFVSSINGTVNNNSFVDLAAGIDISENNVVVSNNVFNGIINRCINISAAVKCNIIGNDFLNGNASLSTINTTTTATEVMITNNLFNTVSDSASLLTFTGAASVNFNDNKINCPTATTLFTTGSSSIVNIVGNKINSSFTSGFTTGVSANIVVSNNNIISSFTTSGSISVGNSASINFSDNIITSSFGIPISSGTAASCIFADNIITSSFTSASASSIGGSSTRFTFNGNKFSGSFTTPITLSSSGELFLSNNNILNSFTGIITFASSAVWRLVENIITTSFTGANVFSSVAGLSVTMQKNRITSSFTSTVISGNTSSVFIYKDNYFTGTFSSMRLSSQSGAGGDILIVDGNTFSSFSSGILILFASLTGTCEFTNNTIYNHTSTGTLAVYGFNDTSVINLIVSNNTINISNGSLFTQFSGGGTVNFDNNQIYNASALGLVSLLNIVAASAFTVSNNVLQTAGYLVNVNIGSGGHVDIIDNTIKTSATNAIRIDNSTTTYFRINNNKIITVTSGYGILLVLGMAVYTEIMGNHIESASSGPISASSSFIKYLNNYTPTAVSSPGVIDPYSSNISLNPGGGGTVTIASMPLYSKGWRITITTNAAGTVTVSPTNKYGTRNEVMSVSSTSLTLEWNGNLWFRYYDTNTALTVANRLNNQSEMIRFTQEFASGTNGGSASSGYNARNLNTTNTTSGVTWATTVTLGGVTGVTIDGANFPGIYLLDGYATCFSTNGHNVSIWEWNGVSWGTFICTGSAQFSNNASPFIVSSSIFSCGLDITSSRSFSIYSYCQTARATNGLGLAITTGLNEVYVLMKVVQLARY